ncbi:MAG: STT3 domain-containing protein [Candidatus Omnitrophota bacterium]
MNKYLTTSICLLAVLSLSIYFRSYPLFLPLSRQYAEKIVQQQSSQKIAQDINKKYPALADLARARLFEAALADYKKSNKADLRKQTKEEYAKLKDRFQDKFGRTYLMELDCWHWARYVANIGRFGGIGNEVRNGVQFDSFMLFPQGNYLNWSPFFYYLCWYLYQVFSFFHPMALMDFLFYLPLFFMAIFTTLLYFFCWRNWGNLVAVICCVFVGTGPIFIPRSCAGWFDMDIPSMIFSVLIIWTYLLAYSYFSWKKSILWVVFSAFWLMVFCSIWVGWSFILFIIIFYEFIVLANFVSERLQYGQDTSVEIKKHLIIPAVFLGSGIVWIVVFTGFTPLIYLKTLIAYAVNLNNPMTASIWPNVFTTIGELKNGDYLSIAKAIGGPFSLALALVFMLWIFLNINKYRGMKRELLIILVVWFMTMFFFCSKGIRFAMFLLVPLGIFLGWGIEELYQLILKKKWKLALIPLILSVVWLMFSFVTTANNTAKGALPIMDDSWYSLLTTIKKHTPADSVINSWWDFGDWFKSVSERRVIFDGQTQNTPQAYWMARVLITDSEQEAVGTLRMLNNGGNKAFDIIDKYINNQFKSVSLLRMAIMLVAEEGKSLFSKYLPPSAVKEVTEILYSRPKQKAYFIVDSSMIGKMLPISYLGNWDFIKVYLSRTIRIKSKEQILQDLAYFGLGQDQAERYYQEATLMSARYFDNWVSQRLSISGIAYQKKSDDDLVLFNNGFIYNPDKKTIYSYASLEERYRIPRSLFLIDGYNITEKPFPQSDSQHSALLLQNNDMYKLVLLSPALARSVFVRLLFLNGRGLRHFVPFTQEGPDENRIIVFEIKWD